MTHEETLHAQEQIELIKAVAHLRAAATLEYAIGSSRVYREQIDKLIDAVEELVE